MKNLQVNIHATTDNSSAILHHGKVMSEAQMDDKGIWWVVVLSNGEFRSYDTDYLTPIKKNKQDNSQTKELEEVYG